MSRPAPADLKPLTSLRFFAAMMIATLHFQEDFSAPWQALSANGLRQGVSFFFVLSGFILTHVYIDQPGLTVRRFLTLRLARLYPTHLAALVLLVAVLPWRLIVYAGPSADASAPALGAKLLLVDALIPTAPMQYAWNGVSWSLSTEIFFYLAFPFLVAGLRANWPQKLALAALVAIVAYLLAATLGFGLAGTRANLPTLYQFAYSSPLARGFEFVLGMSAYVLWERLAPKLALSLALASGLEAALLILLALWIFAGNDSVAARAPALAHLWMIASGSCLPFALAIAVFASGRGLIGQALSWRPMVWLGQISFSFYMLHQIALRAFAYYWGAQAPLILVLGVSLALAGASWRWIELPGRRLVLAHARPARNADASARLADAS